uniref:DYW domain-containing protein n=1 Tax=Oryza meridionalis TaxID=40149 RepID=A0A0E0DF94_9ORYZ
MQDALRHPLDPISQSHWTDPGCIPIELEGTDDVRLDFDQNEKEASDTHHSKKLAIAFSLMKLRLGATIQLSKNLRVCLDCHSTTKVYNREIVVRGKNRFQSLQRWFLLLQ